MAVVVRTVQYTRHEMLLEDESRTATLDVFVYDVPSLDVCGIFPPLHILNQILCRGGGDGGMSPGASWQPFALSESEYAALLPLVLEPDLNQLKTLARYTRLALKVDPEFDGIQDYFEWMQAVAAKHRDAHWNAVSLKEPTLFVSIANPGESTFTAVAEIPLPCPPRQIVLGQELPFLPGMRGIAEREIALPETLPITVNAHVELEGRSFAINVCQKRTFVASTRGRYGLVQNETLYGADLTVRLPTEHCLSLTIYGPPGE